MTSTIPASLPRLLISALVSGLSLLLGPVSRACQDSEAGATQYLAGLDQLERAAWTGAVDAFSEAVDQADENPDYFLARGVAQTFAEKLEAAERDLRRADRLRPNHDPTRMWLASVVAMRGRLSEDVEIFPAATHDPYETAVREMSRRYGNLPFQQQLNPGYSDPHWQQEFDSARAGFAGLARQFAQKSKPAGGATAGLLAGRGLALFNEGQFAAARDDLEHVLASGTASDEAEFALAGCLVALGNPAAARARFTALLVRRPDWAEAHAGRALSHLALGNLEAADADNRNADALEAAAAGRIRSLLGRGQSAPQNSPEGLPADPLKALRQLHAAALGGGDYSQLLEAAGALVRSRHASRLHADEQYQRRRFELEQAVGREPDSADRLAELGEFLFAQTSVVLTEWVEPRSLPRPYRPVTDISLAAELAAAEKALDQALRLQPGHPRALAFKAACLIQRDQFDSALPLLEQALAAAPDDSNVLELLSQIADHAAAVSSAAASDLRQVRTWTDWQYQWFRYPSQDELYRAGQLTLEARRLWELADEQLARAGRRAEGTPRGHYLAALIARRGNNLALAREELEKAVQQDPGYGEAWRSLVQVLGELQLTDEMQTALQAGANRVHTTAGPMLRLAWLKIARTAWSSAEKALFAAAADDPADPRVAALLGIVSEGREKPEDAAAWLLVAAAIDEANSQLEGRALDDGGRALNPAEAGLSAQILRRAGEALIRTGKPALVRELLESRLSACQRVPEAQRYELLPGAMLPDLADDGTMLPEADNLETIVAWGRLALGEACLADRKPDQAAAHFQWVAEVETRKPSTLDMGSRVRVPQKLAQIGLVKQAVARGDLEQARFLAMQVGRPRDLPAPHQQEWDQLRQQLGRRP